MANKTNLSLGCLAGALAVLLPLCASAGPELTSASYRLRGGALVSGASALLTSTAPSPTVARSGGTLGGSLGATSSGPSATVIAGFWGAGILAATSDVDGDGVFDLHETDTGTFVSAMNTGSDPLVADTDGDGFSDGAEVAAGTDPNNALDFPAAVHSIPPWAWLLLAVLSLLVVARVAPHPRPA